MPRQSFSNLAILTITTRRIPAQTKSEPKGSSSLHVRKTCRDTHQLLEAKLAELLPDYSRNRIQQWIETGGVLLDGKAAKETLTNYDKSFSKPETGTTLSISVGGN